MCSYRERCISEDSPFEITMDFATDPATDPATDTATDYERSPPLRTQLQLVGSENDMALKVGDVSPDFELPAIAGDCRIMMRSRDYRGRQNLVVAFHPLDWTPT